MKDNEIDFFTEEMYKLYVLYNELPNSPLINNKKYFEELSFKNSLKSGLPIIYRHNYQFLNSENLCDVLLKSIGEKTLVPVRYGNYADPKEYTFNRKVKTMQFGSFIKDFFLKDVEGVDYLGNYEINKNQQEFLNIKKPNAYSNNDLSTAALWIGKKGCVTPLHCDGPDSFIYQLSGSKKWTLFSPSNYPFLQAIRPLPEKYPFFYSSQIDFRNVNSKEANINENANSIEVTLNAGEALYVPSGWFHFVETIADSIMLNFIVKNQKLTPAVFKKQIV